MTANVSQLAAIRATEGPVLIIAGPGSGKTFTLVERIVNLVTNHGAAPENLFVVTFTDKAARELTTRISNRLNELRIVFNLNEMYLGTFHSICLRILQEHREFTRLKRSFALLDQFDQQFLLYKNLNRFRELPESELVLGKENTSRWGQSALLLKHVNKVAEEVLDVAVLLAADVAAARALGRCFHLYQQLLNENNALDFAGIQLEALRLLQTQPQVLIKLHQQLTYLMVDEYQDTNTVQEFILKTLMGDRCNLCVVGDDDQGLYRFRGATIRNILEFTEQFPPGACNRVTLTTNYRSHPGIISFYNSWMADQLWTDGVKKFRYDKLIQARDGEFPTGPAVVKVGASDASGWHGEVVSFLLCLRDSGALTDWNQVAFLFRSVKNEKVVALAAHLETAGIPVYSPRSNLFFDREEIRLMIGALIFLFPQFSTVRKWKDDAHLEIWNYYDQRCFELFVNELRKSANASLLSWARPVAKRHMTLIQSTDYAFSGLFYQLLQFPLFSQFLEEKAHLGVDKGRAARNLATLSKLLAKFEHLHYISVLNREFVNKNLRDLFNQFFRFLKEGGINEYEDDAEYAPSGCVSFLTIHQSKGLEFPVVICGSLEATPRKQHTELDELLQSKYLSKPPYEPIDHTKFFDFRRLFYTAFSRAQNLLVLATQERNGHGRSPSKYFEPHYDALPNWRDPSFRPEALTFENVKEINLKRQYSFTSHITLFENCAVQYRFFKELEFNPIRAGAQLFGTLVHQTIEDIHKAALRGEEHLIEPEQIERWMSSNYIYLSKRERQYLAPNTLQAVLSHVLRYYEREKGNWARVKEAEVEISLVKEDYILTGSVDLIRGEKNTVEIIDFKSEKKPDMEKDRDRLRQHQRQLEVYAHLVEQRTGQLVSRMHLYYTGEEAGTPYVTFPKNDRTIDQTIAEFDDVVSRIEAKNYEMPIRPTKLCANCDMRAYCDEKTAG